MDPSPVECVGRFLAPWLHPEGEGLGGSFFFFFGESSSRHLTAPGELTIHHLPSKCSAVV